MTITIDLHGKITFAIPDSNLQQQPHMRITRMKIECVKLDRHVFV
jgi:hypothetical protein